MKTVSLDKVQVGDWVMLGGCWHKVYTVAAGGIWTLREWDGKEVYIKAPCGVVKAE